MATPSLILNQNELLVFLSLMGASALNGFDDPLADPTEAEVAQRLDEGRRSLAERGLITEDDDSGLVIDDVLVALAGGSLVPEATLALTRTGPENQPVTHYFSATPELLVEHFSPAPALFRFDYLPDTGALAARLGELLAPLDGGGTLAGAYQAQVPAASMTGFFEYCRQAKPELAGQILIDGGCSVDLAEALAGDFPAATSWIGVAAWGLRRQEPDGADSVMAMVGAARCWLVMNVAGQADLVDIRQANRGQCADALRALVRPLSQVSRSAA